MKLLICTQAVDENDPVLGFFVRWIAEFAKHADSIEVICLREGSHALPANAHVHPIGEGNKLTRAIRLKMLAWRLRAKYDTVFVHMNPEYLIVAGPLWHLLGKRVAFWYNHPADNVRLRLAALFAHKIFYTSSYAATAKRKGAQQMPVGIDTELFKPASVSRERTAIYMQGRIMPSKRVELALAALRILRERVPATLTLVGPEDAVYGRELRERFKDLIETGAVTFLGSRKNTDTPALYSAHGIALNLAASGHFDKSVFEAMACETPVIVSSQAFMGLVPEEWIVPENNPATLAAAIEKLMGLPEGDYHSFGTNERSAVVEMHGITALISRIIAALEPVRE